MLLPPTMRKVLWKDVDADSRTLQESFGETRLRIEE